MQMPTAMVILWFHNTIEMELKNLFTDLQLSILDLGEMEFLEKVMQDMKVTINVELHILIVVKLIMMSITQQHIGKDQL